eukprot:scaffold61066_cov43-Phaeocystis_antarctica.AAC.2
MSWHRFMTGIGTTNPNSSRYGNHNAPKGCNQGQPPRSNLCISAHANVSILALFSGLGREAQRSAGSQLHKQRISSLLSLSQQDAAQKTPRSGRRRP